MSKKLLSIFIVVLYLSFLTGRVIGHNPGYEVVATYGSTPIIDGSISIGEWEDASSIPFNDTQVFVKQDGINLYVGFNVSATTFHYEGYTAILFDVNNDGSSTLQSDDIAIGIINNGTLLESNVTSGAWNRANVSGWTASFNSTLNVWQAEFNITYSKLNVIAGSEKTLGAHFRVVAVINPDPLQMTYYYWPPSSESYPESNPSTWGDITSTGYNWIPEFSSLLILPLFITATLLAVIVYKRKHTVRQIYM